MKYCLLLSVTVSLASCGGGNAGTHRSTPVNNEMAASPHVDRTVLSFGNRKLVIELPNWKVVNQTPEVTSLLSQESEVVSVLVAEKENSSLAETCPIMFRNIDSDQVAFLDEQPIQSTRYSGLVRGYYGNVPSLGGKVVFLYYCLQSNDTFLKLDFMISPDTYARKKQNYDAMLDRFVLY